jgi:L-histidine N-alpha-methyltransferase
MLPWRDYCPSGPSFGDLAACLPYRLTRTPDTKMSSALIRLMREEVASGLSRPQKELPPKYFYDVRGSRLFEEITRLPEYYLTRAERALLEARVGELIASFRPRSLTELGAGSAGKTRIILDAMRAAGTGEVYQPIDVSAAFLASTATRLRGEYPELLVQPVVADFTNGLPLNGTLPSPTLCVFLGSTIGNLEPAAAIRLLAGIGAALAPAGRLLLGVDLKKEVALLEAAYNDAAGVTAEFNRNLLLVLNRELGANFEPALFEHLARYYRDEERIEMHLISTRAQRVAIPGCGTFEFHEGETIRTEISNKYDRARVDTLCRDAGLQVVDWYADAAELFALALIAPLED